ncbi:MAG: hypothetical protein NC120_12955 [Ruminococcus sp.]|nr:hypothetical protein [Ruminococcus sp.]
MILINSVLYQFCNFVKMHNYGGVILAKKLKKSTAYSDFFNNLIDICEFRNTSPTTLAEKFAHKSVLTAWKNGKIDTCLVTKLSLELDVPIDCLFTGNDTSLNKAKLSDDERNCLMHYNQLTSIDKVRIIEHMAAWYEKYTPEEKEKAS